MSNENLVHFVPVCLSKSNLVTASAVIVLLLTNLGSTLNSFLPGFYIPSRICASQLMEVFEYSYLF